MHSTQRNRTTSNQAQKDNQRQEHPQIVFLDSSTSSNQTVDLTNNTTDPTPHGTTETPQSSQCQTEQNMIEHPSNNTEPIQEAATEQLQLEKISQLQMNQIRPQPELTTKKRHMRPV